MVRIRFFPAGRGSPSGESEEASRPTSLVLILLDLDFTIIEKLKWKNRFDILSSVLIYIFLSIFDELSRGTSSLAYDSLP